MRRQGLTLPEGLIILAFLGLIGWVLLPTGIGRSRHNARRASCQSNLKQISLAMKMYSSDYNNTFPPVHLNNKPLGSGNSYGWVVALPPYLNRREIFNCPSETHELADDPSKNSYTDYWFNARLSRLNHTGLRQKALIIMMGDGNDGTDKTDANYNLSSLPVAWRSNENSPACRHLEGANYAFADGHVKWLKPDKVTDAAPTGSNYTFRVR